ncbi:DUF1819 family protein [uncultured Ruminococcus sp.]|uniref:DUF1819 family protein n=1 Tax=uncultured Ruminococcus sp. TaxID=165186 RepID=UPI0025F9D739|nr:DUF1819 family protein [uncultured Ruminococcus sp.]
MPQDHYSGGLTREQFLFFEMRVVAGLAMQGKSREDILAEIFAENLFQFPTERMIRSITNTCFKRIDALDSPELVSYLADASAEVAKQINLYAIMCENSIVYDFMTEVIGEKYRSQELDFSAKDVNVFFMELAEKVPAVDSWSESTIKKLKQVLVRFLVECEYLENSRSDTLMPVYLYPELEAVIRGNGDTSALAAFNCFS